VADDDQRSLFWVQRCPTFYGTEGARKVEIVTGLELYIAFGVPAMFLACGVIVYFLTALSDRKTN
jgi:hypothetical protein